MRAYRVQDSPIHGKGLFAARAIAAGEHIVAYVGERISKEISYQRRHAEKANVYIVSVDDSWDIDGDIPENDAKFANHSCAANCALVLEDAILWLTATRAIAEGEELSFDYGFSLAECLDFPCHCAQAGCCGYILAEPLRGVLRRFRRRKK